MTDQKPHISQLIGMDCDVSDETEWYIDLDFNDDSIDFNIDGGADVKQLFQKALMFVGFNFCILLPAGNKFSIQDDV